MLFFLHRSLSLAPRPAPTGHPQPALRGHPQPALSPSPRTGAARSARGRQERGRRAQQTGRSLPRDGRPAEPPPLSPWRGGAKEPRRTRRQLGARPPSPPPSPALRPHWPAPGGGEPIGRRGKAGEGGGACEDGGVRA